MNERIMEVMMLVIKRDRFNGKVEDGDLERRKERAGGRQRGDGLKRNRVWWWRREV